MSLQYYAEPFFSFSDVNRFFDDAFGVLDRPHRRGSRQIEGAGERSVSFRPKIDVHENPESNLVTASFELPGLKKEDVAIDLRDNRLIVAGETRSANEKTDERGFVVKERSSGTFSRMLPVPSGTKPEDIKASMEHGVLTVTFPKTTKEETAKRITIS
ncbi:HSP20-like chaperone [Phellopilus nigrolimitatus]|nr:HSP20-like chaperone [Phellopilus nigrolimitatus]